MRRAILSLVVASAFSVPLWMSPVARAHVPVQPGVVYGPDGYVTGEAWRAYPPGSVWQGYSPGTAWSGYAPPVTPGTIYRPPVTATAPPGPVTVYPPATAYAPATLNPRWVYTQPGGTVTARPATSRRTVAPAYYREFGTGRNIFMHKPWLPNQ